MKFEINLRPEQEQGYALVVEGEWFDNFDELEDLLNTIGQLQLMSENPMVADFTNWLAKVPVRKSNKP